MVWAPGGDFDTLCEVNMQLFPFDTQICHIDLGSINGDDEQLSWQPLGSELNLSYYTPSNEFELKNNSVTLKPYTMNMPEYNDSFVSTSVRFTLTLRRQPLYFVLNIFVPGIVLSVLALVVFMLPTESGEKMGLGITVLLAFTVYMLILSDITPQTSNNIPLICEYPFCFVQRLSY